MGRSGPRTVRQYSDAFKLTAVRLSQQPGVMVKTVAAALAWVTAPAHRQELPRAPERVLTPQRADQLLELRTDRVRRVMWGAAAIHEATAPLLSEPGEPLVAHAPAHAAAGARLGHRVAVTQGVQRRT